MRPAVLPVPALPRTLMVLLLLILSPVAIAEAGTLDDAGSRLSHVEPGLAPLDDTDTRDGRCFALAPYFGCTAGFHTYTGAADFGVNAGPGFSGTVDLAILDTGGSPAGVTASCTFSTSLGIGSGSTCSFSTTALSHDTYVLKATSPNGSGAFEAWVEVS